MPTEYANSAQCRAAGVEPVPQVGDIVLLVENRDAGVHVIGVGAYCNVESVGPTSLGLRLRTPWAALDYQPASFCRLVRRDDVTIPQHSDTPEGEVVG